VLLTAVSYISADADETCTVGGGGCTDEASITGSALLQRGAARSTSMKAATIDNIDITKPGFNLSSFQHPAALIDTDGEGGADLVGGNRNCRSTSDFGASYRGSVSTTYEGYTCQRWTSQKPHSHSRTPSNYHHAGIGNHNYCRNPDGGAMPWCYTTNPNPDFRWGYCSQIPLCCRMEFDRGASFRGNAATTVSGRTCQKWTDQAPHRHGFATGYGDKGVGNHNYCRNPDGGKSLWCYTTDPNPDYRWEYCSVPICTSPRTCPSICKHPSCRGGSSANGGQYLETRHGKCGNWCGRKYGGVRYCGVGAHYNHIDCGGCRPKLARGEEKAMTLCYMSYHVYSMSHSTSIPRDFSENGDFSEFVEIDRQGYEHPYSSRCHQQESWINSMSTFTPAFCVYLRRVDKQAVLAVKGTTPTSASDLAADIQSVAGGTIPEHAMSVLGNVIENLQQDGYKVLVTGHSLGGYIAEILATTHNLPGMVFQAPGPDSWYNPHNGPYSPSDFNIVNAQQDPFGNLKYTVFYHKKDPVYMDGLRGMRGQGHSVAKMCKRFEPWSMIDITNKNVMSKKREQHGYYYIG